MSEQEEEEKGKQKATIKKNQTTGKEKVRLSINGKQKEKYVDNLFFFNMKNTEQITSIIRPMGDENA